MQRLRQDLIKKAILAVLSATTLACSEPIEELHGYIKDSSLIPTSGNSGKYTVSPLFSDGMVLQRNSEVSIFGTAEWGYPVTVQGSWSDEVIKVYPNYAGKYVARIKTPDAGGPYTLTVNDSVFSDVMIGEVWVCAGQSNMQLLLSQTNMAGLYNEDNPNIRIFKVPIESAEEPKEELSEGKWYYGHVNDIKGQVTAVGYYFARKLQNELNIPIGMICAARGSTGAEEWMNADIFNTLPSEIKDPFVPTDTKWPGCWYNAMIYPLFNYTIRGAIWYQGENNASRAQTYPTLMSALVKDWRENFNNPEMPFYMVQLPAYGNNSTWPLFRTIQQTTAQNIENCQFITSIDTGEEDNIHPKNKLMIGERLGELALANNYGYTQFRAAPPVFDRMEISNGQLTVYFKNVNELKLTTENGSPLNFEICGTDGAFYPANAQIIGTNAVQLSSDEVSEPADARYFWIGFAQPNILTDDGWPLAPFNTTL